MSLGGGPKKIEPTEQERALAESAAKRHNEHQEVFVPLEDSFIASLTASKGEMEENRGAAVSDVSQALKGNDAGIAAASRGQAGQGKSVMARGMNSISGGTARGEAVAGVNLAERSRKMKGLQKMSAFGRGLQDMSNVSMADAARTASGAAINKLNVDVQKQNSKFAAVGTLAGTALGNIGSMDSLKGQLDNKFGTNFQGLKEEKQ